jgi:hypothetical protein
MRFHALALLLVLMSLSPVSAAGNDPVDTSTLRHKVLCGYQGWFRAPGDSTDDGWKHWSRDPSRIVRETLTFEMWPDMAEYGGTERYAAPGFTTPDGAQAHLFSSANPKTVDRHFEWMRQYGIDGAFVQRFLVELDNPTTDLVLRNVRASAEKAGRAYVIGYDMTAMPTDRIYDRLVGDWKRLVDEAKVTRDGRYLRHAGKPVVFVWGFYPDRFDAALAHRIIDFFKNDPEYGVTLIGGGPWYWRDGRDPEWARAFRRFDVISPWNVGNVTEIDGRKHATTAYWKEDLAEATKAGMAYLPVIYPGFGWTNLKGPGAAQQSIPRLGGEFFWRQFSVAADLGVEMAYVAMFDEVDEATAIFKVSNTPPTQASFQTYEGLPSDWYLRLAGEGTRLIRGERENSPTIPIEP